MVYLIGLIILPLSLLYSPKADRSQPTFFAKTMTITQERNSPAYSLFKAAKTHAEPYRANELIQSDLAHGESAQSESAFIQSSAAVQPARIVRLTTETISAVEVQPTGEVRTIQNLEPMAFTKEELTAKTDAEIKRLFLETKNSALLAEAGTEVFKNQTPAGTTGITIRGAFELRDGVGIVDHIVSLYRFFQGQYFELGQVDLRAGLYQIQVTSFEGELIAEVKDKNGYVIGEDRQELTGLKQVGKIFEGPALRLGKPSSFSLNSRFADDRRMHESDNGLQASLFSGNYELKKTNEDYPNVSRQSLTVGFVHDPSGKTVNTLTLRGARDNTETVLFSKLWLEGAKTYVSERAQIQFDPQSGSILGRIVDRGNPVENIRVSIDDQPGVEVYYLDEFWIPQTRNTGTSKNGYFFIPGLTKGSYQLSSFDLSGGRNRGSQLFVVDENALSYQEIIFHKSASTISFMSYDAFTSQPMAADLALPADENVISIDDSGLLKENLAYKNGAQEIVVRPPERNYLSYTTIRSGSDTFMLLPQIREDWVNQLAIQARIKVDTSKSMFVGFTATPEYSIMLADSEYNNQNRVYFTASGELSQEPSVGGGVIFFNLEPGLHEVVLHENSSMRVHTKAFFAKENRAYVSVFKN